MNTLPEDPMILFSFINTKLRDNYASLDALCDDMHISKADLVAKLGSAGFEYNPSQNKFWYLADDGGAVTKGQPL